MTEITCENLVLGKLRELSPLQLMNCNTSALWLVVEICGFFYDTQYVLTSVNNAIQMPKS